MSTIRISLYNYADLEEITKDILCPSFVVNPALFQNEVQYTVNYFQCLKFTKRYNSEIEKPEDERDEEFEEELKNIIDTLEPYEKGDYVATTYAFSMGLVSGTIGIAGFNDLFADVLAYADNYIGAEAWTDSRKSAFTAIKKRCNDLLAWKFDLKTIDDGRGIYKPFTPEMSSKSVELFINSCYGQNTTASTGKKDAKVYGIRRKAVKKERAFVLLCMAFFKKYGCEVSTAKKVKLVDVIL